MNTVVTRRALATVAAKTPALGFPLATGPVQDGRTFYVAYATGST